MLGTSARVAVLAVLTAGPLCAQIGLGSGTASVSLTATRLPSIGVSLPPGTAENPPGTLVSDRNAFAAFPIATTWDVDPTRTAAVSLVGYFVNSSFTQSGRRITGSMAGSAGGTLLLFTQPISLDNAKGSRTDGMRVRIDLSGWRNLSAGTYQGTLNLLAITE
jgi:hypothetical protein